MSPKDNHKERKDLKELPGNGMGSAKYDPEKHHRRSIRLKGYDYAQPGAYFVTVVAQDRTCFFGDVANGEVRLNNAGCMVQAAWTDLSIHYPGLECGAFVVMPNHIHGIIIVGGQFIAPSDGSGKGAMNWGGINQGVMNRAPTLGKIVRAYKAVSTRLIRQAGTPDFAWQRNYYEHIVRDEESLDRIRRYILDNPARWEFDRENPAAMTFEPKDAWGV